MRRSPLPPAHPPRRAIVACNPATRSPPTALVAFLAPQAGKLAGRIGQRPLLLAGGLFYAAGGLYRFVFLGRPGGLDDALAAFDRVWFVIVAGGLITTLLCLPMRTGARADADPAVVA